MFSTARQRLGRPTLQGSTSPAATRIAATVAWLFVLLLWPLAAPARAESAVANSSNRQELWIINTRCVGSCGWQCVQPTDFGYQRLDCQEGWQGVDGQAFFETGSADVPTCFYIHGNRVNPCDAVNEGQYLYRLLCDAAGNRPFRLVIWSWPAAQIRGRIRDDVQIKAGRSDVQAYYLAQCVDRMAPDVRVSMMGHSFGARTISGALHILAGGAVAGRALEAREDRPRRAVRAVLVAAALDNGWLLPGRRNGQALEQVEQMLITRNGNDRVLKWYPLMYGRGGPQALGFTGPACPGWLGEDRCKLEVLGVSCSVGNGHGWFEYLCSWPVRCRLPWYAFVEPDLETEPDAQSDMPTGLPTAAQTLSPLPLGEG